MRSNLNGVKRAIFFLKNPQKSKAVVGFAYNTVKLHQFVLHIAQSRHLLKQKN